MKKSKIIHKFLNSLLLVFICWTHIFFWNFSYQIYVLNTWIFLKKAHTRVHKKTQLHSTAWSSHN
jgi:hypothetical protein